MSKVLIDETILKAIGDAIRVKNGDTVKYRPSEMAPAILALKICGKTVALNLQESVKLSDDWMFKLMTNKYDASSNTYPSSVDDFESISIPHDWSIHRDFDSSATCGYEGGFLDGGDAWYIKDIDIEAEDEGKTFVVNFDGVYSTCEVYMNGTKAGENHYGYNSFAVDVTNYINAGQSNRLAVFVRNRQPSSRWYSGSGIYRNVHLLIGETVNASVYDAYITTPDLATELSNNSSTVKTNFNLSYKSEFETTADIKIEINDENGNLFHTEEFNDVALEATENGKLDLIVNVSNPRLWNVMDAHWYTAKVTSTIGENELIAGPFTFGYRSITWDKDGLYINNNKVFMKGVCLHHDLGLLGAEVNESAIDRQLRIMKEMGCNAIRITHNPASSEFLDAGMKYGFIMLEEFFDCWSKRKKTYDFGQYWSEYPTIIKNVFDRDKNNPGIIMWSMGNEVVRESNSTDLITDAQNLVTEIKKYDTIRPITYGEDVPTNNVAKQCMQYFDILGLNYGDNNEYSSTRTAFPDKTIYGSETTSALSTRGCYVEDEAKLRYPSLDNKKVSWGDYAVDALKRHMSTFDYLAGMFVWTGFDYIGEPTSWNKWPAKSSYFGIVDLAGFPKDVYYLYQQEWSDTPMVHAFPAYQGTVGSNTTIYVYSNCERVELFINGESKGSKTKSQSDSSKNYRVFTVPYVKGTAVVNGYDASGNLVAQDVSFSQMNESNKLVLSADKTMVNNTNNDSLIFVECDITDVNSTLRTSDEDQITFSCVGGEIIGTDAGDSSSVERMRTNVKKAMYGKLLCMVKPNAYANSVIITATSKAGLSSNTLTVATGNKDVFVVKQNSFMDATNPTVYDYGEVVDPETGSTGTTTADVDDIEIPEITPGTKFNILANGSYDMNDTTVFVDLDIADNAKTNENLVSIGSQITAWYPDNGGYALHVYGPNTASGIIAAYCIKGNHTQFNVPVLANGNKKVRLALSKNGLYVNGVKVSDASAAGSEASRINGDNSVIATFYTNLSNASTVTIGSQEGNTRSTATYNAVKMIATAMTEEELYQLSLTGEYVGSNTGSTESGSTDETSLAYVLDTPKELKNSSFTIDKKLMEGDKDWTVLLSLDRTLSSSGSVFTCGNMSFTHDTQLNRVLLQLTTATGSVEKLNVEYSVFTDSYMQMMITKSGSTYTVTRLDGGNSKSATVTLPSSSDPVVLGNSTYSGTVDEFQIWDGVVDKSVVLAELPDVESFTMPTGTTIIEGHNDTVEALSCSPVSSIGKLVDGMWLSSPSDSEICTAEIKNGRVHIRGIASGETSFAVSCGSLKQTTNITVEAADVIGDPTVLFSLTNKVFGQTVGNGVDFAGVDTDIQLLNEDKDFTVFVKFENDSEKNVTTADSHAIIHCMHESDPWPGMSFQEDGNNLASHWWKENGNVSMNAKTGGVHSVAFVHESGTTTVSFYFDGVLSKTMNKSGTVSGVDETCMIGCYHDASGAKGRFWNGTIYNAKIYNTTKTADEIAELHES